MINLLDVSRQESFLGSCGNKITGAKRMMTRQGLMLGVVVGLMVVISSGCTPVGGGDPYYGGANSPRPPYGSGPYYGRGGGWYDAQRREKKELKRERRELEKERNRLERERRRQIIPQRTPIPRPTVKPVERCPAGYSPSEQKCSAKERTLGCKDMRLPGGLGCVNRKAMRRKGVLGGRDR
jgi:hypothetical protein